MEEGTKAKWFLAGHATIKRGLSFRLDLLQDRHRLVAPHEDVIRIKMACNSGTGRFPVPNCLHLARPVMLAIPQKIRNAAANLHAGKTLVELRIIHDAPHSLVGKHSLAVFIESLPPAIQRDGVTNTAYRGSRSSAFSTNN